MTVLTWPGPTKPSSCKSGESSSALSAGTIVMWLQKTLKFSTPSFAACKTVRAVEGAVVSKPSARKTTSLSGFFFAIFSASSGE